MDTRKKLVLAAGAAASALAVASIAFAAIPGAGGVIHGCWEKQAGHLRVYDPGADAPKPCGNNEVELTWNQQGQQGQPGPQGPKGDTGAPGPKGDAGPSDAWASRQTSIVDINPPGAFDYVVVNSLSLPAGSYLITGKGNIVTTHTGSVVASCSLIAYEGGNVVPFSALDQSLLTLNKDSGIPAGNFTVTEGLTLAAPSTVQLKCGALDSGVEGSMLTAVRVGNLTTS